VSQQLHSEQRRMLLCFQDDLVKMPALVVRWICERKSGRDCQQFDGTEFHLSISFVFPDVSFVRYRLAELRLLPSTTPVIRGLYLFEGLSTVQNRAAVLNSIKSKLQHREACIFEY
jgi:hypothetical protein